jgi:nitronate monooxygenase
VRYAQKVEKMGADMVTVVGYENGGATGKLDIGTLVLVPTIKDAIDLPVIGGGGVSDGRGILAVLSLGADAVIIGTRLLTTRECPIHENVKQALLNASELDTTLIMRSINATHRVWRNASAEKCAELEAAGADFGELYGVISGEQTKKMFDDGEVGAGILACGQGVGLCREVVSIKELLDSMMEEAASAYRQLGTAA